MKITQAVEHHLQYHKMNSKKNTVRTCEFVLSHFSETFADWELEEVGQEEVLNFLTKLTNNNKQSTKRNRYSTLSSFYNFNINTASPELTNHCTAPIIKKILDNHLGDIHGMVHCSGGAQTKILHFVDDLQIVKDNMFDVPPLFRMIHEQSGTDWKEMYKVFNMGHRMEIYVPQAIAESIIAISKSFNVDAQIVGRVEASSTKKLTIESEYGTFTY